GRAGGGLGVEGSLDAWPRRRRTRRRSHAHALRRDGMAVVVVRGDVHLVRLDPTLGSEIQKTRPCVIVSPDELNAHLRTVIVAPMTTGGQAYPWRIRCQFQRRSGYVVLDQLRTVDRDWLIKRLGELPPNTMSAVLEGLQEMFAE